MEFSRFSVVDPFKAFSFAEEITVCRQDGRRPYSSVWFGTSQSFYVAAVAQDGLINLDIGKLFRCREWLRSRGQMPILCESSYRCKVKTSARKEAEERRTIRDTCQARRCLLALIDWATTAVELSYPFVRNSFKRRPMPLWMSKTTLRLWLESAKSTNQWLNFGDDPSGVFKQL